MANPIRVRGKLMGVRLAGTTNNEVIGEVVQIPVEMRPHGPAENSFILAEASGQPRRARYLSWINYFDLEYAIHRECGKWQLIEPAREYDELLSWMPFGWPGAIGVPVIGDSMRSRGAADVALSAGEQNV